MLRLLTMFIWALCVLPAYSQRPGDLESPIIERSIDQWTSDDGLVSNNLTNVFQAKSGFLWISSFNGMVRFDGQRFELFNRAVMPFLASEAFYRIYESPSGELWLATQGSGIVKYARGEFKPFIKENKVLPKSIRCLALSPDGSIYAGSNNKGLYLIQDTLVSKIEHEAVKDVSINSLVYDLRGNLWIGTNGKGLVSISGDRVTQFTIKEGLLSNVINAIRVTSDGEVVVGTSVGLNVLSNKEVRAISFLKGQQINDLQIHQDGSLWAATDVGLGRLNLVNGKSEFLGRKQGLPSLEITSLQFDNEGSLWLTTSKAGLVRLKKSTIITYTAMHGLSTNEVNVVTEDAPGRLYIGSDGGDIDVLNKSNFTSLSIKTNLKNVGIRDIFAGKDGVLWISSYMGVLKKRGSHEKLFTTKEGLPADDVRRIFQDSRGNLWFGSRSGGLAKFRNDKVVSRYNRTNGLESNYILCITEDDERNIYAGTNGGGIARIGTDGTVSTLHLSDDDSGVVIFNLHVNHDKSMWVVTNLGLFQFRGQQFKKIKMESQTVLGTCFDLKEDNGQGIWVSTNKGILYFTKEDAGKFMKDEISTLPIKQFDEQDGMKSRECTSATPILKSSNGEIWIPTISGVARINPKKIFKDNRIPPVYITHVITDKTDTLLTGGGELVIRPGNLRYVFQFTALSFMTPKKVSFKYQLEGIDESWVEAGTEREAHYTNLPPGAYQFKVIACNNDGVWNERGAEVSMTVQPYFYQTVPFYFLLIILLILVLFLIYKWRLRILENRNQELKKLNSELDKFVYSASHDLRAPLSSILGLVNVARQEPPQNKDFYLNLVEKSVHKLDQFIRDIIDFSRNARLDLVKEEINFELLVQDVLDEMKYMDEKNRILRTIKVIGQGPFYSDSRRLVIILNNLVSNAIKYHNPMVDNPYIEIRVELNPHHVTLNVSDNGNGIGQEHLNNIFKMFYRATETSKGSGLGLYIVHETVEKLSGKVSVQSTLGEGSTFEVTLPSLR